MSDSRTQLHLRERGVSLTLDGVALSNPLAGELADQVQAHLDVKKEVLRGNGGRGFRLGARV